MDEVRQDWLGRTTEPIRDPELAIVDTHHHLWPDGGLMGYAVDDLVADTTSGHRVTKTVFVECHAAYRVDGPAHLRPVGETGFVAAAADDLTRRFPEAPPIAGIVAHADLRSGDELAEVLDAHEAAAGGRFRGIRHAGASQPHPGGFMLAGNAPPGLYADDDFRAGLRTLGRRGLTYDTWHYHHQNADYADLAAAVPDTMMVLDHFGTPPGVGAYADRRAEIFEEWSRDIAGIARHDNVVAKLGGLSMPDNGFGWHTQDRPPTSDEVAAAQQPYYLHTIECFGPDRCMVESNFPVDKLSLSYPVLWNAIKVITADFSPAERTAMFSGTAERVYRL